MLLLWPAALVRTLSMLLSMYITQAIQWPRIVGDQACSRRLYLMFARLPYRRRYSRPVVLPRYNTLPPAKQHRGFPRPSLCRHSTFFANLELDDDLDVSHLQKISPFWRRRLQSLRRPAARCLVDQIVDSNELGYDAGPTLGARRGTLFDYVLKEKKRHPDKVLLVRVGEFYETYGIDALMLVEHGALNSMGGKCKAGCPVRNVQQTLDGLTSAGLTVVVIEEANEVDTLSSRTKLKARFISQIVSPGASTYLYDSCLKHEDVEFKENRPYVGLLNSAAEGYTLLEIHVDARVARLTAKMTVEAVRVALQSGGMAEPIYVQGIDAELLRALLPKADVERKVLSGWSPENFDQGVIQKLSGDLELDLSGLRTVRSPSAESRPRPVYLSTALQIGLLYNPNVPDLVKNILPHHYSAHSARFLRKWLLTPPPSHLAEAMQALCRELGDCAAGLPRCSPMPVGKLVSMLGVRQGNGPLFREIYACLRAMCSLLTGSVYAKLVPSLRAIAAFESGIDIKETLLRDRGHKAIMDIEDVISCLDYAGLGNTDDLPSTDKISGRVPSAFFERNEQAFRGSVRPHHPLVVKAYALVQAAAEQLCRFVAEDFPAEEIVQDPINNTIVLRRKPQEGTIDYVIPTDRNRKPIPKRYTTSRVEETIGEYLAAVDRATAAVKAALQSLSDNLRDNLPALVTSLHFAVVVQAAAAHVVCARQKGWTLPELVGPVAGNSEAGAPEVNSTRSSTSSWAMHVDGLVPYWMQRGVGIQNIVDISGVILLTAPNMSGKSTLMRSLAVAALMAACGLHVPVLHRAKIPRYDNIFLRTASYDIPAEGKSAFALEMSDVTVLLNEASSRSLVFLDEIGKGTSSREGACLSAALLEWLDETGVSGIFATHLHEVFNLKLNTTGLIEKQMRVWEDPKTGEIQRTYILEDGRCLNSLAVSTARGQGVPERLLQRTEHHLTILDEQETNTSATSRSQRTSSIGGYDKISNTASVSERPLDQFDSRIDDLFENTSENGRIVNQVAKMMRMTVQAYTSEKDDRRVLVVSDDCKSAPALEGSACVYTLIFPPRAAGAAYTFYVGETEGFSQRLTQHKALWKARVQTASDNPRGPVRFHAAALGVRDKTQAKSIEAALIQRMKRAGYQLRSDKDSNRRVVQ